MFLSDKHVNFDTLKDYKEENDCGVFRHDWSQWYLTDQIISTGGVGYWKRDEVVKKEKKGCRKCGKIKRKLTRKQLSSF
tara:strand:- start:218 stop:454 length:237 start_codon:yes stop_codon:yes gene_type:complete